jgi:hypothetical protein
MGTYAHYYCLNTIATNIIRLPDIKTRISNSEFNYDHYACDKLPKNKNKKLLIEQHIETNYRAKK